MLKDLEGLVVFWCEDVRYITALNRKSCFHAVILASTWSTGKSSHAHEEELFYTIDGTIQPDLPYISVSPD